MREQPKTVKTGSLATQALQRMEESNILQLIVIDENINPVGIIHLRDVLEARIGSR